MGSGTSAPKLAGDFVQKQPKALRLRTCNVPLGFGEHVRRKIPSFTGCSQMFDAAASKRVSTSLWLTPASMSKAQQQLRHVLEAVVWPVLASDSRREGRLRAARFTRACVMFLSCLLDVHLKKLRDPNWEVSCASSVALPHLRKLSTSRVPHTSGRVLGLGLPVPGQQYTRWAA